MSNNDIHEQAAELLPCCTPEYYACSVDLIGTGLHHAGCPAYYRPALAAKLREQYIAGLEAARDVVQSTGYSMAESPWAVVDRIRDRIRAMIDAKKGEGK